MAPTDSPRAQDDVPRRATVISLSQSRSADCGRAFSAGKDPMMPEVHCAMTRSGVEMMNIGEARTGTRSCDVRSAKVVTWNRLSDRRIREVFERRSVLRTLPAADVGRSSTSTTSRIFLYGSTCSATNALICSASNSAPGIITTKATGSWPLLPTSRPTTAAVEIAGRETENLFEFPRIDVVPLVDEHVPWPGHR